MLSQLARCYHLSLQLIGLNPKQVQLSIGGCIVLQHYRVMNELERINTIFEWLGNGGRVKMVRELKTNAGQVFAAGEELRLVRLEPSLVDHSFIAVFESEANTAKIIRIRETSFDRLEPI
ncbi:hypothetical protein [Noviherbaspirillum sp. Root189]|uniref:hypothetical protein n=1 Tax=Noviherbaspirillum sp. Root189 TaxID=1736487 RepID=UPI0012E3860E|nr:hypothetical protein [Noviherbaspirillum sp. Root189]